MFQKKNFKTSDNLLKQKQKDVLLLVYNIGLDLINDLAKEENQDTTMAEYGQKVLEKYPKLQEFRNNKKEDK